MLCEQCNQNTSTVYITSLASGQRTKRQLCQTCAQPVLDGIAPNEKTGATFLGVPAAQKAKLLPEQISIPDPVIVRDLAATLTLAPFQVVGTLMRMNVPVSSLDAVSFETASRLCASYGVFAAQA